MRKRLLEILCVVFCIMSIAVSLVQGERRLKEDRKRTVLMLDMKTKVDKLWENLQ